MLLPELERLGQRPTIVAGTSAGTLNGAFLAATAHLPAEEAAAGGREIWAGIAYEQVLAPLVSPGALGRLAAYLGEALGVPGARVWSVLASAPLRKTVPASIDFAALERNVADGVLRSAAVVATSSWTSRSVVFHRGGGPVPPDERRAIDYLEGPLRREHVLASSAIPTLFPASEVDEDWYTDGGTRLTRRSSRRSNSAPSASSSSPSTRRRRPTSVAPARTRWSAPPRSSRRCSTDRLLQDLRSLEQVNELVAAGGGTELTGRRHIPYALVASERPDTVGALAREVFAEHYTGLAASLHHPDVAALGRAVAGGTDAAHGELLSYLFFAPEFTRALLELGRRDAERRVAAGLWTGDAGTIGP